MTTNRQTHRIDLPSPAIGTRHFLTVHEYNPQGQGGVELTPEDLSFFAQDRAYIQASLHADELPGMLVTHHLIKLLDKASARGAILKPITLVPFANPLGLSQRLLGVHMGRFALGTGVNFNRDWIDVTKAVADRVREELRGEDAAHNVAVIRKALYEETCKESKMKVENVLKRELFKKACISSVVLDLHCDTDAVMHMYTHDRLWPGLRDLSALLDSRCNIVAGESGGTPFDESCSCPWAALADLFPTHAVPMACQSATVELRGEADVYDDLAARDARALFAFLVHRGFVRDDDDNDDASLLAEVERTLSAYDVPATPLTGVDMIEASVPGVLAWKVHKGDIVEEGQVLGEIVNIEDVDAPRVPIVTRTAGIVFGVRKHKLAVPGEIAIKVAGQRELSWRTGPLLTA